MLSTTPLSVEDIDDFSSQSFQADDPLAIATGLVEAADLGHLADKAETGYALIQAAEIAARVGQLETALDWAERSAAAYQTHGDPEYGYPLAFRASLLMRLGREDEAMAEFIALRPLLTRHANAASYLSDMLAEVGRPEIAEQWLTTALTTVLQQRSELESGPENPANRTTGVLIYFLTQQRHRIRRTLGLPHDEHDDLADRLAGALDRAVPGGPPVLDTTSVLFWPPAEFNRLLLRWPTLANRYGETWDKHRANVERELVDLSGDGYPTLSVAIGAADDLVGLADRQDTDPTDDPELIEDYTESLALRPGRLFPWPPERNRPCWCGSGSKYKKCCLPRTRR